MLHVRNRLKYFYRFAETAGIRTALAWVAYRGYAALGATWPSSLTVKPRQANYAVRARLGFSSDMLVLYQIFLIDEYACVSDLASPRLILDLGANIGYSSAYFLTRFPTATVIAVEPEPGNYSMCKKNLEPYGERAKVIHGAVWSKRSRLTLTQGGDGREWAMQVRESEGVGDAVSIEGWDISSLLELADGQQIDLLKIDIERSEIELFGVNASSWLPRVRNICIELHGPDCDEAFFGALKDYEYDLGRSGELTLCRNLRLKSLSP